MIGARDDPHIRETTGRNGVATTSGPPATARGST